MLFRSKTVSEAVHYILKDLLVESLELGLQYIYEENGEYKLYNEKFKKSKTPVTAQVDNKGTSEEDKEKKEYFQTFYDADPTINQLYWASKSDENNAENRKAGKYTWGRIERVQYGYGKTKVNVANGETYWDTLVKNAGVPMNEFWVDVGSVKQQKTF